MSEQILYKEMLKDYEISLRSSNIVFSSKRMRINHIFEYGKSIGFDLERININTINSYCGRNNKAKRSSIKAFLEFHNIPIKFENKERIKIEVIEKYKEHIKKNNCDNLVTRKVNLIYKIFNFANKKDINDITVDDIKKVLTGGYNHKRTNFGFIKEFFELNESKIYDQIKIHKPIKML